MAAVREDSCHIDVCAAPFSVDDILRGNPVAANAEANEVVALADEKGAMLWKAGGIAFQGCALALTAKPRTQST